jgi:tetratricopeptide (TPR) repeat protein
MNALSRFWKEVKSRNIIRRNAMYAASAYLILELFSIITDPLGLPPWTLKTVMLLLGLGLLVSLILSWNYDYTAEGFVKLKKDLPDSPKTEEDLPKNKRKLRASDVIIAVLAIAVVVLAYPRIFNGGGDLNAMSSSVTVFNEFGEEEVHEVFKEDYITRLVLFPFENENPDSSNAWMEVGIMHALSLDLTQFSYFIALRDEDTRQLHEQLSLARNNNYSHFVTGSYHSEGEDYLIRSRLYNSTNGSIEAERVFQGRDFFGLIDSISIQVRKDLGISDQILNAHLDLPFEVFATDNLKAFEFYTSDPNPARGLKKAIELDSTFALALLKRSFVQSIFQANHESAMKNIDQAMRHRQRLSEIDELRVRFMYYGLRGETEKVLALAEMRHQLNPYELETLHDLIYIYEVSRLHDKLLAACEKLNELKPGVPGYQIQLAHSYLLSGKPDKGIAVMEELLSENPEHTGGLMKLSELYLHKNDLDAAEDACRKAILARPEEEEHWGRLLEHMEYIRKRPGRKMDLEAYTGHYRYETGELSLDFFILNKHLVAKARNQRSGFQYPVSDSVFISFNGFHSRTFRTNEQNEVVNCLVTQRNIRNPMMVWKEDSLIRNAEAHLTAGRNKEALRSFLKAHEKYPGHFYLAHYIQHLEYLQNTEHVPENGLSNLVGEYGRISLYTRGDHLYYEDSRGFIFRLLPMDEDHFMLPSRYNMEMYVEKENGDIKGIRAVWKGGQETFFQRDPPEA